MKRMVRTLKRLFTTAILVSVFVFAWAAFAQAQTKPQPQTPTQTPAKTPSPVGVAVGPYEQEVGASYTKENGLPSDDVFNIEAMPDGTVYAATATGLVRLSGAAWSPLAGLTGSPVKFLAAHENDLYAIFQDSLMRVAPGEPKRIATIPNPAGKGAILTLAIASGVFIGTEDGISVLESEHFGEMMGVSHLSTPMKSVRSIALGGDTIAVGADSGLFTFKPDKLWQTLSPREGTRSWAPVDVKGVAFDTLGRLWFAGSQGVGRYELPGATWTLFTPSEGLPFDDFTCMAAAEKGAVWFGTTKGAIRFDGKEWEYRQGRRWLPNDQVRDISVDSKGGVWFATPGGVGHIERRTMTLRDKAHLFEAEIDKYHRRTPYGYVDAVGLDKPGDKSHTTQYDSDNDGLWTAMYGAGECFAYAATHDEAAKTRAKKAFEALRFLSEVTQGGQHSPPKGFPARSILPVDGGRDPNQGRHDEDKREKEHGDKLWKVIDPRWPISKDGKWYWKCDTSSDELDGHYFFYAQYYDLAADTEQEKQRVREVVAAMTDHLILHGFALIDHDGKPTRWAVYSPQLMNFDRDFWEERGLNSLSMISYLRVAEHVTGSKSYRNVADKLIKDNGYAMNIMIPKTQNGFGSGNQSDDEMAFMDFYNLMKYETDPELRQLWGLSFHRYWQMEEPEMNPFFNFLFAAVGPGEVYRDAFGERRITANGSWLEDSVDTLKRFPLDRVEWGYQNSHRKDIIPLPSINWPAGARGKGRRLNGKVLPIDERFVDHWNVDPWQLNEGGNGQRLADGASYLLPYYLGLYHGFVIERPTQISESRGQ